MRVEKIKTSNKKRCEKEPRQSKQEIYLLTNLFR